MNFSFGKNIFIPYAHSINALYNCINGMSFLHEKNQWEWGSITCLYLTCYRLPPLVTEVFQLSNKE